MIEVIALTIILAGTIYFYNKPCHNCVMKNKCKLCNKQTGYTLCDKFDLDYPKGSKHGN